MNKILRSFTPMLAAALFLLLPADVLAQIPSGYVQTTATVSSLANGTYAASWTNLSSSPQLALLGCVSSFQQTVNGNFDSNGHFSVLLADTAQICPTPSTWTFMLTFACPSAPPTGGFQVQVAVTGGGGTEDISSQITAALPSNPCGGGSGGSISYPGATAGAIPVVASTLPTTKLGNSGITQTGSGSSQVDTFPGTVSVGGGASSATLTVNNSGQVVLQGGASSGVTSINSTTGAMTFTGSGVSQSGNTFTFSGGGGSMTWPSSAGITVYAGSNAWGTSLAAPAGTIVGTTDTQTLTNKTLDGVTPTTMGYVDPTSSIQTQLNGKQPALNLVQGTYVSGDICTYNSTGTLLNCNTAPSGTGTVTSFAAPSASWPTWLVPTVTNSTTTPSLAVAASAIPNSALATQTANTVLGALTSTTPSGLSLPSCSGASSALTWASGTGFGCNTIASGTGTVTSFSAGALSPLFTTAVATATTTPALSFTLSNAAAYSLLFNNSASSAAPTYVAFSSLPVAQFPTLNQSTTGAAGSVSNAVTFAASGGASPGATFNGSAAVTVSPATIGAAAALGDCTAETSNFNIATTGGCYSITGSTASQTATFTATVVTGTLVKVWNNASVSWTVAAAAGPTLTCYSNGTSSCVVPAGGSAAIYTVDGTNLSVYISVVGTSLPAQAANTVVMNATGGSAAPTAVAMPTCTTGADLYNTSTNTWSCVSGGTGAQFSFPGQNATVTASSTTYAALAGANSSPNYYEYWEPLLSCTASNMYVVTGGTQDSSGSLVVTLYYGAFWNDTLHATSLAVTIPASSVAGTYSNTTSTVATTSGYLYGYEIQNSATVSSAGISGIVMECK